MTRIIGVGFQNFYYDISNLILLHDFAHFPEHFHQTRFISAPNSDKGIEISQCQETDILTRIEKAVETKEKSVRFKATYSK